MKVEESEEKIAKKNHTVQRITEEKRRLKKEKKNYRRKSKVKENEEKKLRRKVTLWKITEENQMSRKEKKKKLRCVTECEPKEERKKYKVTRRIKKKKINAGNQRLEKEKKKLRCVTESITSTLIRSLRLALCRWANELHLCRGISVIYLWLFCLAG